VAARRTPEQAKAAFLALVAEHGGELAEGAAYRDTRTPVDLVCREGHACDPHPFQLLAGGPRCGTCARQGAAIAAFLARVAELGAELAAGAVYVNSKTPVDLVCDEGHGICLVCSGQDPATSEARFWARVHAHGARPAPGAVYVNRQTPVDLICAKGTRAAGRRPRGRGCASSAPAGTVPPRRRRSGREWTSSGGGLRRRDDPLALICAAGHRCSPTPAAVNFGHGICQQCVVVFDPVYLLVHPVTGAIKVGTASGKTRVRKHFRGGYRLVVQWSWLDQ
jgi:hypothetical protein